MTVIEGTYNIWRRRNPNLKPSLTAIDLNQHRRRIQKTLSELDKENIRNQFVQSDNNKSNRSSDNVNDIPPLCKSIDRCGPLNQSLNIIGRTSTDQATHKRTVQGIQPATRGSAAHRLRPSLQRHATPEEG